MFLFGFFVEEAQNGGAKGRNRRLKRKSADEENDHDSENDDFYDRTGKPMMMMCLT